MKHFMQLTSAPYALIKSGRKVIESRLFDEKRSRIQIGDSIVFSCNNNPEDMTEVRVVGILRYRNFEDLFSDHNASMFGGTSKTELLEQIGQFYSSEEIEKFGVVGIRIEQVALPL